MIWEFLKYKDLQYVPFSTVEGTCNSAGKIMWLCVSLRGLPRWLPVIKNLSANAGDPRDTGSILGSGRSPGVGNGNPLQYSCLENPIGRWAWWVIDHRVAKSQTWLNVYARAHTHTHTRLGACSDVSSHLPSPCYILFEWLPQPPACAVLLSWNTSLLTFYSGGAPHCLLIKPSFLGWYSGSIKNGDLCYIPVFEIIPLVST